ncbi:hydroxypyruvate isomerase family protein [Rubinisphaera margarita]|uniref:hydroxypyruvate isomerase family protein n=1 Tax=Rubinisphaera margarita TaxID=2909586 RepID=UPI001EE8E2B3|nr:TIM barrel protein [Rubinisphaera margarita]MCG6155949.1 TIM barrel protein [Rubinisphaera margarita]
MQRREVLAAGIMACGTLAARSTFGAFEDSSKSSDSRFKLKYAPHFGMFRQSAGDDLVAQLEFMHEEGFRALEDNRMLSRPKEEQDLIAKTLERLDMEMGVFVATGSFQDATFASGKKEFQDVYLEDLRKSVELAKRVRAKWVTVVPGIFDHKLPMGYQTANVVEGLKRCAEICEPSGLIMVLEPLNHFANHPELFLHKIPQAYQICKAVDSPSCKILFDLYHQQITEGNLIPNIDHAWEEVAYFQVGDNPGRKEPGTGEINYRNVFKHIHSKGFDGIVGMEHGNSKKGKEGERAVIDAYVDADSFEV